MKKVSLIFIVCLLSLIIESSLFSQSVFLPSNHPWHDFIQRMEIKNGASSRQFHEMIKPLPAKAMVEFLEKTDSTSEHLTKTDQYIIQNILQQNIEWTKRDPDSSTISLPWNIYRTPSDFYRTMNEDFFLAINPVINLSYGREKGSDSWNYQNTRGIEMRGMINQKVGFYSFITDNQARFPVYVNEKINDQQGAIPGEGWNIPFGNRGYDFFSARGYITFQAAKNIGFQFGQDRNFLGSGKRSLLLSDYSQNYLFLKINTQAGRFHFQNLFARLVDFPLRTYGGRMYDPKYMAAHTLSIKITPQFEVGFFENVVFGRSDTLSKRNFDLHYLNPIIFYRAAEHHIGDPDKIALGTTWRWITPWKMAFYGQIYLDDFHIGDIRNDIDSLLVSVGLRKERKFENYASFRNKFGLQAGIQFADFMRIKNLDLRIEANRVRPFTYSHYATDGSDLRPASSYSHYSQALAHPLGANFGEILLETTWRPHPNLNFQSHFFWAKQGMNQDGKNYGQNILLDYTLREADYGHVFLQGKTRYWMMADVSASWQIKPDVWIDVNYTLRNEQTQSEQIVDNNSGMFFLGLRVNAVKRNHWF
ncbi:MAG: hypothetical protein ACLFQS_03295 [Bacteroidales bacterium]